MGTTPDLSKPSGRRFPLFLGDQRSIWAGLPDSIPWEAIVPREQQANVNHGKSLETLARMGGLSPMNCSRRLVGSAVLAVHATGAGNRDREGEREN